MVRERIFPVLVAATAGIISGFYIWRQPLEQYKANSSPLSAELQPPNAESLPGNGSSTTRVTTEKEASR